MSGVLNMAVAIFWLVWSVPITLPPAPDLRSSLVVVLVYHQLFGAGARDWWLKQK